MMKITFERIIAILSLLTAIIIGYVGIQTSKNIAIKSGAYEKPIASLFLVDRELLKDRDNKLTYGFQFKQDSIVATILPLAIENKGEKSLKNISITIRYPKISNLAISNEFIKIETIGPFWGKYQRKTYSIGNFDYVSFFYESINPGKRFITNDVINISETKHIGTFHDPKTKMDYSWRFDYSSPLLVTLSGENIPSSDYKILLSAYKASDMEDLKNKYSIFLRKDSVRTREEIGFFKYLLGCIKAENETCVLVYAKSVAQGDADGEKSKLFWPPEDPNDNLFSRIVYKYFSYSYLF